MPEGGGLDAVGTWCHMPPYLGDTVRIAPFERAGKDGDSDLRTGYGVAQRADKGASIGEMGCQARATKMALLSSKSVLERIIVP